MDRLKRIVLVVAMVAVGAALAVASEAKKAPEVFTTTTANMTPANLDLRVNVLKWSTMAERVSVLSVINGEGDTTLEDLPTMGYVWPDGSGVGYSVKYAYREEMPEDHERITLVTGRPLGTFSREPWTVDGAANATVTDFTVIEFRLDADGKGAGTMSLAAPITIDPAAGTVSLDGFDNAPVLLDAVTREPKPYWASDS